MKDYRPEPRLVITISEGLISNIVADGIDLSHVTCFVIDEDTEGADDEEEIICDVGGQKVFLQVRDITPATEQEHDDYGAMHQNWMICDEG